MVTARLVVAANGFWRSRHQMVFIDVKVFNSNASSYRSSSLSSLYCRLGSLLADKKDVSYSVVMS